MRLHDLIGERVNARSHVAGPEHANLPGPVALDEDVGAGSKAISLPVLGKDDHIAPPTSSETCCPDGESGGEPCVSALLGRPSPSPKAQSGTPYSVHPELPVPGHSHRYIDTDTLCCER